MDTTSTTTDTPTLVPPAIAEYEAMSEVRKTLVRAETYAGQLDTAGIGVLSIKADAYRTVAIHVAPGTVRAAAEVLGFARARAVYGSYAAPTERIQATDGQPYTTDYVFGAVSA